VSFARESGRLLAWQLLPVLVVSGVFFWRSGANAAAAVWFGGGVAACNGLLLAWRRHHAASGRALSAGESLRLLYRTALERFVMVALLLALGLGVLKLHPLALLTGFLVGQLALVLTGLKEKSARHVV
jgi:ATP synthase protein I